MKKSMTEYISSLTNDNYERLEELISKKYRKFIKLYWLISDYSNYISILQYKNTKHDTLKIKLRLSMIDINKVISDLLKQTSNDDSITIKLLDDGLINIEIKKDESELP